MNNDRDYLREATRRILQNDPELANEVAKVPREKFKPAARDIKEAIKKRAAKDEVKAEIFEEGMEDADPQLVEETIVQKVGRPVLLVQDGDYRLDDPMLTGEGTDIWKRRLFADIAHNSLLAVIRAVGRVEVANNPDFEWVGTAWLIGKDIVVTNRHVVQEFAQRKGQTFEFLPGFPENGPMRASIDFLEEHHRSNDATFVVKDILYIADRGGPDMALLKVEKKDGTRVELAGALRLAKETSVEKEFVATLGYPAADSRVPDQDLVKKFFGDIYNKKRLAPGQVLREHDGLLMHDCSTLGGNSGSCIVRIDTGEVVGLHFSGLFLRENRAVPARVVADIFKEVERDRFFPFPGREEQAKPVTAVGRPPNKQEQPTPAGAGNIVKFNLQIPVELRIAMGTPSVTSIGAASISVDGTAEDGDVGEAVRRVQAIVGQNSGVLEVRRGYAFENGWITSKPAVVVSLAESSARSSLSLPSTVLGIPVEVRDPGLAELMPQDFNDSEEGVRKTVYKRPADFSLKEVDDEMKVTCHLSPDSGWPVLEDFLKLTKKSLTMGIYDFTAPHVVTAMVKAVKDQPKTFTLVMQKGESMKEGEGIKGEDWREAKIIDKFRDALGDRFTHVAASVGTNRQFASSYHIKVIVRDGSAFWLSSGNLQSSNQYSTVPEAGSREWWHLTNLNREWNVVIENKTLAKQFEQYLQYDYENAAAEKALPPPEEVIEVEEIPLMERVPTGNPTYFEPLVIDRRVRVKPLLTPDNYDQSVLELIDGAEKQILFQNQSLNLQGEDNQGNDKNDPRFTKLYGALLEKQKDGLDVRIIMRGDFNPQTYIERLQDLGFDMERVRLQDHCHTKGIVVDSKKVLVGSHNWTNEGTLANRDASLIFDDEEIAHYFAKVFWFDWKKLALPSIGQPRRVHRVRDGDNESPANEGRRRTSLINLALSDFL